MRHALDRGRAGPDYTHPLVLQFVQAAGGVAARILIVPATRMERMPPEFLDPRDCRELGPIQRTTRHDHIARLEDIAAIRPDRPAPLLIVPARIFDLGLEARPFVKIERPANPLGVCKYLRREGVLFLRQISGLFE